MAKRNDIPKVYLVTFPNRKQYVGITSATLELRKTEHFSKSRKGSNFAIHNALRKYDNSTWEILNLCSSFEEAKELEKRYIKELNTLAPNGYNLTIGGDGFNKNRKFSEEHRKNLSESHKGYVMPKSQKLSISLAKKGKSHKNPRKIERINLKTGEIKTYNSYTDMNAEGIFNRGNVYAAIRGVLSHYKGYSWKFAE